MKVKVFFDYKSINSGAAPRPNLPTSQQSPQQSIFFSFTRKEKIRLFLSYSILHSNQNSNKEKSFCRVAQKTLASLRSMVNLSFDAGRTTSRRQGKKKKRLTPKGLDGRNRLVKRSS